MTKEYKNIFKYKVIGDIPGLIPGEYNCELVKLEVKTTKTHSPESLITLKIKEMAKDGK